MKWISSFDLRQPGVQGRGRCHQHWVRISQPRTGESLDRAYPGILQRWRTAVVGVLLMAALKTPPSWTTLFQFVQRAVRRQRRVTAVRQSPSNPLRDFLRLLSTSCLFGLLLFYWSTSLVVSWERACEEDTFWAFVFLKMSSFRSDTWLTVWMRVCPFLVLVLSFLIICNLKLCRWVHTHRVHVYECSIFLMNLPFYHFGMSFFILACNHFLM